tara:strand:- start:268 stop:516 length:249 start_codon:yes stop_codon:yes gene_type:complete
MSDTIEIIPPPPHVFQYRVQSDGFTAEFDAESLDAARERLHRYAAAAPDVQVDLFERVAFGANWSWVSSMMSSECGSIEVGD